VSNENDAISHEFIKNNIKGYLDAHQHKSLLRFITCGSVDDGKSTLIGRLLLDSNAIFKDQIDTLEQDSKRYNSTDQAVDLSLIVDGLQSEREQGITIDVAYRYFATSKRKFIIADSPGHEQYTRNMATAASTAQAAVILIDANKGLQPQTNRHSFIASLLGIKHIVVVINKMDQVQFSESVFNNLVADFKSLAEQFDFTNITYLPVSAIHGDNVVHRSNSCPWYHGPTLIQCLENVPIFNGTYKGIEGGTDNSHFRFPVQYVNRTDSNFRGFAGTIASGSIRVGDEIAVQPSGKTSTVKTIVTFDGELPEAEAGQAVTLVLEDEVDIGRGDLLVHSNQLALVSNKLNVDVIWMSETAMIPKKQYDFKFASKVVSGSFWALDHKVNINNLEKEDALRLELNEIGQAQLSLNHRVAVDAYKKNKTTGAFIVIDRMTNATVAAGMVNALNRTTESEHQFSEFELEFNALVRRHFPHWESRDISKL